MIATFIFFIPKHIHISRSEIASYEDVCFTFYYKLPSSLKGKQSIAFIFLYHKKNVPSLYPSACFCLIFFLNQLWSIYISYVNTKRDCNSKGRSQLLLFTDIMILYTSPKDCTRNLFTPIHAFNKASGCKNNMQKHVFPLHQQWTCWERHQ